MKDQLHELPAAMHHPKAQNLERAAVCRSSQRPALVRCPVLSQIKPHIPRRCVPLPSISLNLLLAKILSLESENFGFPQRSRLVGAAETTFDIAPRSMTKTSTSPVDIVYGCDYDGI